MKFENKVAIVTGAGSGMGQSVAIEAAAKGIKVVAADINEDGLQETIATIKDHNGEATYYVYDACKIDEAQALCQFTVQEYGGIDYTCYSAGIQTYGTAVDTDEELWDRTHNVNVKGMFLLAKFCIPEMRKRGGGAVSYTHLTLPTTPY